MCVVLKVCELSFGVLAVERLGILYPLEPLPLDERLGTFVVCDDGVGRSWLY